MRTFLLFLVLLAALYGAVYAALFFFQRSLIYFPQPGSGARNVEMLRLPVDGGDDPQAGREMKGMHPMLVLSPKAFAERTGLCRSRMLSSTRTILLPWLSSGPRRKSATSCVINPSLSIGRHGAVGDTLGALFQSRSCERRWIGSTQSAGFVNTDRCKY